ncbi:MULTISPECIES: hypothetical protein [unclassified Bradyrhizobium]
MAGKVYDISAWVPRHPGGPVSPGRTPARRPPPSSATTTAPKLSRTWPISASASSSGLPAA